MKFSIGDKAIQKKDIHANSSFPVYQVIGILNGDLLMTHWGSGYGEELNRYEFYDEDVPGTRGWREGISRFQEEELFTTQEAMEELHRLEAINNKLNEEFNGVREQIQKKIEQAAVLVDEAYALAKPFDKDFFDLKKECSSLYHSLNDGGWSHSHMKC
jgi:hypothetical protein